MADEKIGMQPVPLRTAPAPLDFPGKDENPLSFPSLSRRLAKDRSPPQAGPSAFTVTSVEVWHSDLKVCLISCRIWPYVCMVQESLRATILPLRHSWTRSENAWNQTKIDTQSLEILCLQQNTGCPCLHQNIKVESEVLLKNNERSLQNQ